MNSTPPRGSRIRAFIIGALLTVFTAVGVAGCAQTPAAAPAEGEPAVVTEVPGTDLHRITLTEHAVERVGIKTATTAVDPQSGKLTVPYGAILYDSTGKAWVYTNPEPRVYVRQSITIQRINGDAAVLTDGPPAGTVVVTTGAEELLGAEFDTGE
ncbi:hypothetical protein [Arthrobacter sp. NicSoilB8]|uniref:hypothetical protein n=1 Tax=Arthrobacter sp. NicSoilB8 TaxID=2830998 RepID=UPI001CC3844F|nr:hypothetical protein [Arthrobacter sp. NicSoilB8]BCW71562.1 hypothetical protein NicSoilB8_26060 [Arthrobacter sp. NicSoilB8]